MSWRALAHGHMELLQKKVEEEENKDAAMRRISLATKPHSYWQGLGQERQGALGSVVPVEQVD